MTNRDAYRRAAGFSTPTQWVAKSWTVVSTLAFSALVLTIVILPFYIVGHFLAKYW